MVKWLKVILIVFGLLALIVVGFFLKFVNDFSEVGKPTNNEYIINFEKPKATLYFNARAWGITGDHVQIELSPTPYDSDVKRTRQTAYIYYSDDIYYERQGNDTLVVYAHYIQDSIPTQFYSPIKIIQVELKNYEESADYQSNYEKYGLTKVSVNTK